MKAFLIIFSQLIMNIAHAQLEQSSSSSSSILPESSQCGQLKEQHFYNAEHIAGEDEFPWIGLLKLSSHGDLRGVYIGLATLISRRYVLANAHLLRSVDDYENIAVVLGAWDKVIFWFSRSQQMEYKIDVVTIHPNFAEDATHSRVFHNDIAVIRLRQEVAFSAHIQPICLPSTEDVALSNDYVAHYMPYAGFPERLADGMKKVKILGRVMAVKSCSRHKQFAMTAGQMCAFSSDKLVALGIGSVLMGVSVANGEPDHYHLIGLLSLSGVQMPYFDSDILVRIVTYLDWIQFNMY